MLLKGILIWINKCLEDRVLNENASRFYGLGILDLRVRFGVHKSGDFKTFYQDGV